MKKGKRFVVVPKINVKETKILYSLKIVVFGVQLDDFFVTLKPCFCNKIPVYIIESTERLQLCSFPNFLAIFPSDRSILSGRGSL